MRLPITVSLLALALVLATSATAHNSAPGGVPVRPKYDGISVPAGAHHAPLKGSDHKQHLSARALKQAGSHNNPTNAYQSDQLLDAAQQNGRAHPPHERAEEVPGEVHPSSAPSEQGHGGKPPSWKHDSKPPSDPPPEENGLNARDASGEPEKANHEHQNNHHGAKGSNRHPKAPPIGPSGTKALRPTERDEHQDADEPKHDPDQSGDGSPINKPPDAPKPPGQPPKQYRKNGSKAHTRSNKEATGDGDQLQEDAHEAHLAEKPHSPPLEGGKRPENAKPARQPDGAPERPQARSDEVKQGDKEDNGKNWPRPKAPKGAKPSGQPRPVPTKDAAKGGKGKARQKSGDDQAEKRHEKTSYDEEHAGSAPPTKPDHHPKRPTGGAGRPPKPASQRRGIEQDEDRTNEESQRPDAGRAKRKSPPPPSKGFQPAARDHVNQEHGHEKKPKDPLVKSVPAAQKQDGPKHGKGQKPAKVRRVPFGKPSQARI
ncbi:hypothetical protein IE81DRAFT_349148 [Ceraceosorus guamensis]|uniref:Uncharacterized protein n=1 Tax=Ceraceosorus guamensis TaxID=1522189 RepID=A0A316VYI4_9BASI|nr:hypothetical protein IE81DRAFT_349148 [Ceraceosorus guamensis]PWN40535.1 hypothetical protein IE81DRAFT_349148 [Ceraceosorus guamensis]